MTDLGQNVFIEVNDGEFMMTDWSKYRRIHARVNGMDAQTRVTGTAPTFEVAIDGTDVVVTRVQGHVLLVRHDCWVVSGTETSDLLQHEQGHYYITYIPYVQALQAIRLLRAPIATAHIPSTPGRGQQTHMHNAMIHLVQSILSDAQARMSQLTFQYDAQDPPGTDHGRNRPEQAVWNQRFAASLASGSVL